MNISKISRSIIVAIFVVMIIFLIALDGFLILNKSNVNDTSSNILKLVYAFLAITLVSMYMYIKDKLYKKRVKRNISLIYRYIYIVTLVILAKFLSIVQILDKFSILELWFFIVASLIQSVLIKRIIFNVSRSDLLSTLGMFMYSLFPIGINDVVKLNTSIVVSIGFFAALILLQKVIDELKQKGIKTKKYVAQSILLGISIGASIILGINYIVWIITGAVMLFITINLDSTHLSFPKKLMNSITQESREKLYSIERLNINKLYVVIVIVAFSSYLSYSIFINCINILNLGQYSIVNNIMSNLNSFNYNGFDLSIGKFKDYFSSNLSFAKSYYLTLFVYIIILEVLSFFLKRKYDTKSTIMKVLFICILMLNCTFNLDVIYYQNLFTILVTIIAIVNTSNIYLNREERIKMLVANN